MSITDNLGVCERDEFAEAVEVTRLLSDVRGRLDRLAERVDRRMNHSDWA